MLKPTPVAFRTCSCCSVCIIWLTAILYSLTVTGQGRIENVSLPVSVYNVGEGLAQSTVSQVCQDSDGLIWLVSGGGLQYFDGAAFRSFKPPKEMQYKITGNAMRGVFEGEPGQLFIPCGSSLIRFSNSSGKFHSIECKPDHYPFLFGVTHLGRLLCWMTGDGLYLAGDRRLHRVSLHFTSVNKLPPGFMPMNAVKSVNGTILIADANGCLELEPLTSVHDTAMSARWIPYRTPCRSLVTDRTGDVFMVSEGTIYSQDRNGRLKQVFNTGIKDCNAAFVDREGNFWLSDETHKKIFLMRNGRLQEISLVVREGNHIDTLRPSVTKFFQDKSGNLWFGTDGDGLIFHSPAQWVFAMARIGFTRCMTMFGGELWAGTFRNGLWRLTPGLEKQIRVNPEILTGELYFFDLKVDERGRLWTATNQGIFILNKEGDILSRFSFTTISASFLQVPGDGFLLSEYSNLYRCTTGPNPGLSFLRKQTQVMEFLACRGFYWTGNHFGLYRKDTASGIMASLGLLAADRLSPSPVYTILPVDGDIWIGTEQGIECYSADGTRKMLPPSLAGLTNETVYSLIADTKHRIWFGGNHGAGCIPPERDRVIRFTARNNLQSPEFNSNAALATPDGAIYLGGIQGINSIMAEKFDRKSGFPDVRLISLQVSDSSITPGIPAGDRIVRIHRSAPHLSGTVFNPEYLPPGTAGYSFFLEGYQPDWSPPAPDNTFSYRNLPPGEYSLWARCTDPFGNQGKANRLMKIVIRPPFWETWWFLSGVLLATAFLFYTVFRLIQKAKYRNLLKELEHKNAVDRERLRISQDMHDEVGAGLTQIAILTEIIKTKRDNPAEMLPMIERISTISGAVVDDMSEIIWAMNPKNDNLSIFVPYLRQHASEFLSTAGIPGLFNFPSECPSIPMTSEQRRNLFLVVKEALHNAVKHSDAGAVSVTLEWSDNLLQTEITDNGRGFEPAIEEGKGNGLTGMRKRILDIGGNFSLHSESGMGTRITFSVAMPERVKHTKG